MLYNNKKYTLCQEEKSGLDNLLNSPISGGRCEPERRTHALAGSPAVKTPDELPQAWAEYLSGFPWSWYIHVIPDDYPHPEALMKFWFLFTHRLNRYCYGVSYWKDKTKGLLWAIGLERQKRGTPHIHGLIGGIPDYVSRNSYFQWLKDKGFQFSRIMAYKKGVGAEAYMSKSSYAWKHGEIEVSDSLCRYEEGSWINPALIQDQYCREVQLLNKKDLSAYQW
jgi:hypothetical protein